MATKGVLLCAWGKVCYGYAAFNFAASIKHLSPDVHITFLCDQAAIRDYSDQNKTVFDSIIVMGETPKDPGLFKVGIYDKLPYDYTLFLDVDALCINSIDSLLDGLINDFEADPKGKFFRTHVHGWYDHTSEEDMPMMYWATKSVIWDQYGFNETHQLPGTQSSIQFIAKCDHAKAFYDDLIDIMQNKYIPLDLLKNKWGGTQPDELYLNIKIAKDHLKPDIENAMWFCDNSKHRPGALVDMGYYFLSYFGVRERIKTYFIEWYDKEPVKFLRKLGFANHIWKSSALFQAKHAANKVKQISRNQPVNSNEPILQAQADSECYTSISTKRINLYSTYYKAHSEARQKELLTCLINNLEYPYVDSVIVASEIPIDIQHPKLKVINTGRITMRELVDIANKHTSKDDINIICNTDIYMESGISMVKDFEMNKTVLCLSRWNVQPNGSIKYILAEYSQDAWMWEGKLEFTGGDYNFGLLGCDNKFAYDVNHSGYRVLNPSRHIITAHLHITNERSYSEASRLPRPYLSVNVCGIEDLRKRKILIHQPGKIGDILIVLPIAKHFYDLGYIIDWLCPIQYHSLFKYVDYVTPISERGQSYFKEIDLSFGIIQNSSIHTGWMKRRKSLPSFVHYKYELAGVDVKERFNLTYKPNEQAETGLFKALSLSDDTDYILVHSNSDYGDPIGDIDNHAGYRLIHFVPNGSYTIFDWAKVIRQAKEIHCIDSSLVNLVDVIPTEARLVYYITSKVPLQSDRTYLHKNWEIINMLEYANS